MARWAVFDVDGTLLPKTSMEKWFMITMIKRGFFPFANILIYFLSAFALVVKGNWEDAFKWNKQYLKDLPAHLVNDVGHKFFHRYIKPSLSIDGIKAINKYRSKGFKILIMTGSPDFLAKHLQNIYFPEYLIHTKLETRCGRYTGKILGLHPFGIRKTQILEKLQTELEIDFGESIVFANHHTDADHMKLFGEVVAVNPSLILSKISANMGWKVEMWD